MTILRSDNANLKFTFGIILICCGWIICFNVLMWAIGISFFLLGAIIVLFSKKSLLLKLIAVGIPILLWFVGFELILNQLNKQKSSGVAISNDSVLLDSTKKQIKK